MQNIKSKCIYNTKFYNKFFFWNRRNGIVTRALFLSHHPFPWKKRWYESISLTGRGFKINLPLWNKQKAQKRVKTGDPKEEATSLDIFHEKNLTKCGLNHKYLSHTLSTSTLSRTLSIFQLVLRFFLKQVLLRTPSKGAFSTPPLPSLLVLLFSSCFRTTFRKMPNFTLCFINVKTFIKWYDFVVFCKM